MNPNMGEGKCALRRIPYPCVECTNKFDHAWILGKIDPQQTRYSSVAECKYNLILGN